MNFARSLALIPVLAVASLASTAARAADATGDFDYPELQVTPLASERIRMEAQREDQGAWFRHLPVNVSALATTILGLRTLTVEGKGDVPAERGVPALVVGLGWLATTSYLSAAYRPYASADREVSALPDRTKRERLVRERMAEERLGAIARTGRILTWLSVGTNLGASVFASTAADTGFGEALAIGSAVLAFTPVIFSYEWGRVASQQEEYKKRIFGTVAFRDAGLGLAPEARSGGVSPALNLTFAF